MIAVLRGDARSLPLPDASVDLIVTSPPYFGLRSYTDGGEHYEAQVGSEATPAEYVAALVACTAEWVRVLKPSGSLFVNLGDKYSGAQAQSYNGISNRGSPDSAEFWRRTDPKRTGIPNKSLMGLPWRYALACTDQLGLILRAEIIWAKPNGLPESVTDRVRRAHEQVFHFTRRPRYFSAVDEIREPHVKQNWENRSSYAPGSSSGYTNGQRPAKSDAGLPLNPLGKLPGSVWDIPSQPLTVPPHLGVDHFAAFPMELPRRLVLGWSPPGVCTECGEGRRPVSVSARTLDGQPRDDLPAWAEPDAPRRTPNGVGHWRFRTEREMTGYACGCPAPDAPTRPSVVLDPFGGTGTTALVAHAYGRHGITIDRSNDYCRLAQWRTTDPAERAKAMQVPKPPTVIDGQMSLLDVTA